MKPGQFPFKMAAVLALLVAEVAEVDLQCRELPAVDSGKIGVLQ